MTVPAFTLLVVALMLLTGQRRITEADYKQIKYGISEGDVAAIFGRKPDLRCNVEDAHETILFPIHGEDDCPVDIIECLGWGAGNGCRRAEMGQTAPSKTRRLSRSWERQGGRKGVDRPLSRCSHDNQSWRSRGQPPTG